MKQIEFYPSRGNYGRVWDEEKWFADFNSARKYLTDNWQNVFIEYIPFTRKFVIQKTRNNLQGEKIKIKAGWQYRLAYCQSNLSR